MTDPESYCPNCGHPLPSRESVCFSCGTETPSTFRREASVAAGPGRAAVPWTATNVTVALFLFLAVLLAAALSARALGPLYPERELALETWVAVHLLAAGIAAVLWFTGLRRAAAPLQALGLVRPRTPTATAVALALAVLGFSIGATFLYAFVVEQTGLEALRPPQVDSEVIFPGIGILLTLQALAVVTPITEEALFRGFVLPGLLNHMGAGPAVVATALVFSALHLEPGTMVPIFLTGLALGWLRVKTESLWPCIAAHAAQNVLALVAVRAGM